MCDGPHHDTSRVLDLASLTHNDAASEEGHRGLYGIVRDGELERLSDGGLAFDCASPDDVHRTAYLRAGQRAGNGEMVVEAKIVLVWHPKSKDGRFPAFWEYRLVDAVRVK
jgi:hypothetical protein